MYLQLIFFGLTDKQQNIDVSSMKASMTSPAEQSSPGGAELAAATSAVSKTGYGRQEAIGRRRDLRPALMSQISGVHRLTDQQLSAAISNGLSLPAVGDHIPQYGVSIDSSCKEELDKVNNK